MPSNGESASPPTRPLRVYDDVRIPAGASVGAAHVESLLLRLEGVFERSARALILVDVATSLSADLGDSSQAIDALLEAWKADPTCEAIVDVLEPLARAERRWAEVLETTRALASQETDIVRSIAYAEAMVRWLTRELTDLDLARQWLERIRHLDSTHWQLHMLQAALSREHGDLEREFDELDRAVLSATRKDDRARIHLMMAARCMDNSQRTFSLGAAKKHLDAAHLLFPLMMEPLRGLEQVAVRETDRVALADVLRRQAATDADMGERINALLWLAKIEEEEFRNPELAAKTLQRVIAMAPDHGVANEALERTYSSARAWPELAVALEKAVTAASEPIRRAARLERLGSVLETKLGDVRAALATYERLEVVLPDDETVLVELARLQEKVGHVHAAAHYREKLAALATEPQVRARMLVLAGQLLVPVDAHAAREHFERAVAADPSNQAAWNALIWDARTEDDAARTERYLEQRARTTETKRARASAFVELAAARGKRGDSNGARAAYEEAASLDPTNEWAAAQLVTLLVEEGRYADAEALCEVALSAAERDRDYDRIVTVRRAQARAATGLEKPERALVATLAAYHLRSDSVEECEALVAAAVPMRADPAVLVAREALVAIADNADALSPVTRANLADILVLTGDADRAAVLYDEVLTDAPSNARALAGLAQHHAASGNAIAALSLRRQLAQATVDPDARVAALCSLAAEFVTKAHSDELAAEVYEEARQLRPRDLPTLHKLLALYRKLGKWISLFDVLRSIVASDPDQARKAKTLFTMAQLAKDKLNDRVASLALFEQALDVDPSQLVAFEKIVRILTEDRDWLGLEQMYKRMIVRSLAAPLADVGLQHALYKQLGLVYRDRLFDSRQALEAFRASVHLRPDDEEGQVILRELLSRTGQGEGAIAATLERILRDPLEPTPYPALFALLTAQGESDRAFCVASAMHFLGIVHPVAHEFRALHPARSILELEFDLGPDGYRALLHEELDPAITELFEVMAPAVADLLIARVPLRERLSYPGAALKSHEWLAQSIGRAGLSLGMPSPRVFQRRGAGPALVVAATKPPSLLAHPPAFGGIAKEVVAFLIGKRVFEMSKPLLARALCPSLTELKALARVAARIAMDKALPRDQPIKERLDPQSIARLSAAVNLAMGYGGKLDIPRWSQLADVSAARAGLLLAGDLEAARTAMAFDAQSPSDLSPRDKMKELVVWFLGDASAAMRKALGLVAARR